MIRGTFGTVLILFATLPVSAGERLGAVGPNASQARALNFEDRVAAQMVIEEVYWRHRIWPKENPTPKPPLEEVLPESAIRAKVEDSLKKSKALEVLSGRPITAAQLREEMERMAAHSRAPEVLREIFDALGNDPLVIAETLARERLADRMIRSLYARDERFHAQARRRAEVELGGVSGAEDLKTLTADYAETTWFLQRADDRPEEGKPDAIGLDEAEWQRQIRWLERLPLRQVSRLQEKDDAFFVAVVLERGRDSVRIATVSWPKLGFDTWWAGQSNVTSSSIGPTTGVFSRAAVTPAFRCAPPDTWDSTFWPEPRHQHTAVWTGVEMIVWGGYGPGYVRTGGRYDPTTDDWVATSSIAAPTERANHTAVWTGTEMIVWGGFEGFTLSSGARYNPSTDSWHSTSFANVPTARAFHTAVWTGTEMIVWAGEYIDDITFNEVLLNSGGRYDPVADTWQTISTSGVPTERVNHTAVWTGAEMIVWGGSTYDGTVRYLNTGGRYDPRSDSWRATSTSNAPTPRGSHSAVWAGAEMIVWGGGLYDGSSHDFNTGGRYDPATDGWVATSTADAPVARAFHTAVWTGTEMIVWGGYGGGYPAAGGRYDPRTNTWRTTSTSDVPAPRYVHTAVWTGTEMIVWGGVFYDGTAHYMNTGGRYDPRADSWKATSDPQGAPDARTSHVAVWTGAEMIVWGGHNRTGFLATGGRYDPATDDWAPTSTVGAPTARNQFAAVWTGTEMILWGGNYGPLNTGGRYIPAIDGWKATSTTGAPTARFGHSLVWTGSEMIVWGGYGNSGLAVAGGRYDPTTNGWATTSTTHAPAGRSSHTAVWTGSEMIVWGGNGLNTGGRYNPSSDDWVSTSLINAPAGRNLHAAVWTGSEMIVWGGAIGPGTDSNTGGRYDPKSDAWVATSTAYAPSARESHTAVWSGREMIVWGGNIYPNVNPVSGGRYDPATDGWTATPTKHAPRGRVYHTAVWTGSEMIVWGGSAGSPGGDTYFNSGGRYTAGGSCDDGNPCTDDACDAATGCGHSDNAAPCNDGMPCTTDDTCSGGACAGTVLPPPQEVGEGVRIARSGSQAEIRWNLPQGATSSDVLRGLMSTLPVGSTPGNESCVPTALRARRRRTRRTRPPATATGT